MPPGTGRATDAGPQLTAAAGQAWSHGIGRVETRPLASCGPGAGQEDWDGQGAEGQAVGQRPTGRMT